MNNWDNGPILPGDTLVFGSLGTDLTPNNDTGENQYDLEFTSSGYDLTGDTVDLADATAIQTTNSSGSNDINLPLNVTGSSTATIGTGGSLSIDNTISSGSGVTLTETGGGQLVVSASSSSSGFGGTLDDQGNVLVNGSIGNGTIQLDGGVLGGTGSVAGPITATSNGGTLAPGMTFTTGSVTLNTASTVSVSLNSLANFDQISSTGTVNLNGATLNLSLDYSPASTDSWVIINATSQTPIQGTFANLPQGSLITENGISLQINYAGGTSHNEVVLSVFNPPVANPSFYTSAANTTLSVPAPGVLTNDADPQGLPLHPVLVSGPVHGTLTLNGDGSFIYVPATGYSGSDSFAYEASDGLLTSPPTTVSLVVNPVNLPPQVSNVTFSAEENSTLAIASPGVLSAAVSPEQLPLTASVVAGPAYGTLTLNPDGSFSYLPNTGYVGQDSFTFIATDSNGLTSAPATATINVGAVDVASTVANSSFTVAENGSLFVSGQGVLYNAVNPSKNTLSAILLSSTSDGSLSLDAQGSFTYTPAPNFSGVDTFTYQATDGTLLSTNTATVTITVTPRPVAPTVSGISYSVSENQTLDVTAPGILLTDTFPSGTPTIFVVNGPLHADSFTMNQDGSFSYTPSVNYSGTDSFSYYIESDGLLSGLATVSLTVSQVFVAPTATDDAYTGNENSVLSVAAPGVLANDTDPNGLLLSAVLQSAPAHGTVSLNADGSFVYTPTENYSGSDSFTYLSNDGKLSSSIATVSLTILPVGVTPTAGSASFKLLENTTLELNAPGILLYSQNPNSGPVSINVVSDPLYDSSFAVGDDGSVTYTPETNFSGADSFTYYLTSDGLNSNVATVTLNVLPVPLNPVATNDAYSVNENATLDVASPGVLTNDVDPNGLPLSAILQNAPTHGTVTLNSSGSFAYIPASNYYGTDTFTYIANDGKLSSNLATVTITLNEVSLAPTAENQSFTATQNQVLVVPSPGVLGSATDPNQLPLTAVLVNTTQHGLLLLNSDGSFSYNPGSNFTGTDSFTFKANNGTLSSTIATVTINVLPSTPATITTVQLNPASVTGTASSGRVTRDTTPNFFGKTSPGFSVVLYAQQGAGPITPVGQATADAAGNYSITSAPLPDGLNTFSVVAYRGDDTSTGSINAGSLLIDTAPPVITNVFMNPKTGQIYVTFSDPVSGMNLRSLADPANYSFTKLRGLTPTAFVITNVIVEPTVPTPGEPVTVVLKVAHGNRIAAGRYLLAVLSGGIVDVAGNPLDGKYNGRFPTGDGVPGSQFDALFRNDGYAANVPVSTTRFIPILTTGRHTHRGLREQVATPRGPLSHFFIGK